MRLGGGTGSCSWISFLEYGNDQTHVHEAKYSIILFLSLSKFRQGYFGEGKYPCTPIHFYLYIFMSRSGRGRADGLRGRGAGFHR